MDSQKGDASLSAQRVATVLSETTLATVGVSVSPHLFRASAATTASLHASHMPHLASALLHHTDAAVTEEHYNRASSLSVAGDFTRLIRKLAA